MEATLEINDDLTEWLDTAVVAVHRLAPDGTILAANSAELALMGYARTDYVGRNLRELHSDPEAAAQILAALNAGRSVLDRKVRLRCADGTTRDAVLCAGPRRVQDRIVDAWGWTRALETGDTEAKGAIENAATEWMWAFDALDQALLVVDEQGNIRRMNRAAMQCIGASSYREVLGRSVESVASGPPWTAVVELLRGSCSEVGPTLQVKDDSGRTWDVAVSTGHRPSAMQDWKVVTIADVTAMAALQEALRRNERMAAVGSLIAGVAHEARTPLFGISATLDAFEKNLAALPEYRQFSALLRSNCERLAGLMRDLLEYGRPLAPRLAPVALVEVVEAAIRLCAHIAEERGVGVACRVPRVLPLLSVDKARLVQVFQNILHNALNLSERGSEVRIAAHATRNEMVCVVEDEGPGFAPEDLSRVFEPFFSKRADGTGLGLSIAQRIVDAHHGRIEAANRPQRGAIVKVILPRGDEASA